MKKLKKSVSNRKVLTKEENMMVLVKSQMQQVY